MNNINCDIIKDLLPLYYDDICSEDSKTFIDEHLATCINCKVSLKKIKDSTLEKHIEIERENIVARHMKKVRKNALVPGLLAAMAISIIPPFFVNLAVFGALTWFFIVLAGVLLFGSLTVVPLLVKSRTWLWTLIASTTSLLLLLFTIDSFVGGRSWFWIAGGATFATAIIVAFLIITFTKEK